MSYTYSEAASLAASARNQQAGKPVGNNTRLVLAGTYDGTDKPVVQLRLHDSAVVEFLPDGSVILDSCGYKTVTTKDRINSAQDLCRVYSERGTWKVYSLGNALPRGFWVRGVVQANMSYYTRELVFKDGMRIYPDGKVEGAEEPDQAAKDRRLRAKIKKYVDGYVEALFSGQVGAPGPGDCLYCLMTVASGPDQGKSLGEAFDNRDHLLGHVEERYYVPSLLLRAHKACGGSQIAGSIMTRLFDGGPVKEWEVEYGRRELGGYLRRYITQGVGLSA